MVDQAATLDALGEATEAMGAVEVHVFRAGNGKVHAVGSCQWSKASLLPVTLTVSDIVRKGACDYCEPRLRLDGYKSALGAQSTVRLAIESVEQARVHSSADERIALLRWYVAYQYSADACRATTRGDPRRLAVALAEQARRRLDELRARDPRFFHDRLHIGRSGADIPPEYRGARELPFEEARYANLGELRLRPDAAPDDLTIRAELAIRQGEPIDNGAVITYASAVYAAHIDALSSEANEEPILWRSAGPGGFRIPPQNHGSWPVPAPSEAATESTSTKPRVIKSSGRLRPPVECHRD